MHACKKSPCCHSNEVSDIVTWQCTDIEPKRHPCLQLALISQRMDPGAGVLGPGLAAAAVGSGVVPVVMLARTEAGAALCASVRLCSTSMTRLWKSWM